VAPSPSSSSETPAGGLTGRVLAGRYRLNRPIASGGMAQVWEATDETLARRVAVKVLHPHLAQDESFVRRFRGEAIAAARLAHPSIVSVYDTLSDGGVNAIVMELVTGTTMRDDLDQHGPLQLGAVLAIGTQVADALGAAHASGLVHRDVKPANILLSADGRVLVADFGIAKAAEGSDLTSDGSMVGTAKYLAPEQIEGGPVDGRTDLYALGVVLYEALTGTPPFTADTDAGTALARLHRDPTPPRELRPQIPVTVEQVVTRALSRRPDDRYADAAAMRRALLAAGADPGKAPAVAQAAAAADTGERPASSLRAPPPARAAPPAKAARKAKTRPPPPPARQTEPLPAHMRRKAARAPSPQWPWAVLVVVVLAGAAIGIGIALSGGNDGTTPSGGGGAAVAIDQVRSFDPEGTGPPGENDGDLPLVTDGDPASAWRTEQYGDADLAGKSGVGLVATVAQPTDLARLDIDTPAGGWSARIYVVDGDLPTDLEGWGDAVAEVNDVTTGTVEVELGGRRGKAVLVWFIRLAPVEDNKFTAQVSGLALRST